MSDRNELKRLAERYDIPDDALGELELLMTRKLKAENEALRKWNERYEWLRKGNNEERSQDQSWSWEQIDAAIAKEKAGD